MSGLDAKIAESFSILLEAHRRFAPSHAFGMFSGGHDSVCAVHVANAGSRLDAAAHIDTTIGIAETRDYMRAMCVEQGWPLKYYTAPVSYRDIVLQHGFPGPGGHLYMYSRLKERAIRKLVAEHKQHRRDHVLLITGVRLSESRRRMGHVEPIQKEGGRVWVAPILHWSDDDKTEYMARFGLRRNPVVDQLCMSGECLCGAFAKEGEIAEIAAVSPVAAAEIRALEAEARAAGVHAKWGTRPPAKPDPNQPDMIQMLCSDCIERAA